MGEDSTIKIWDYFFRGRPTPSHQIFCLSEPLEEGFLTNDMEMNFICIGKESNGLYMFRFVGDVSGPVMRIDEQKLNKEK